MKKIIFLSCLLLAGCGEGAALPARDWAGRWNGPEGTYLEIAPKNEGYDVTIRNLDGPVTYHGTGTPNGIVFERDGVNEAIKSGNGQDTGMKWLAGKENCLVVKPGEGFCRD